jgi:hypothetical protein
MDRTAYVMHAFVLGWTKKWSDPINIESHDIAESDLFRATVMQALQGKDHEEFNKKLAGLFGEVVTPVKAFPTPSGWIILDKYTKRLLHKEIKNENEVNTLCKTKGYIR